MSGIKQIIEALKSLLQWWVVCAPWEQVIRVTAGKRVRLLGAGIHRRIPILDRVYRQSTRLRALSLPAQTLTTADGKTVTVALMVSFAVRDLLRLYNTLHHAEGTIQAIVLGACGEFVTSTPAADVTAPAVAHWTADRADLKRYGLDDITVAVATFAYVKTYRMITGDGEAYHRDRGDYLNTTMEDGATPPP